MCKFRLILDYARLGERARPGPLSSRSVRIAYYRDGGRANANRMRPAVIGVICTTRTRDSTTLDRGGGNLGKPVDWKPAGFLIGVRKRPINTTSLLAKLQHDREGSVHPLQQH
jgi:hypothetical protein